MEQDNAKFKTLKPNKENQLFHSKMLDVLEYVSESNEFGIKGLDNMNRFTGKHIITIAFDVGKQEVYSRWKYLWIESNC